MWRSFAAADRAPEDRTSARVTQLLAGFAVLLHDVGPLHWQCLHKPTIPKLSHRPANGPRTHLVALRQFALIFEPSTRRDLATRDTPLKFARYSLPLVLDCHVSIVCAPHPLRALTITQCDLRLGCT